MAQRFLLVCALPLAGATASSAFAQDNRAAEGRAAGVAAPDTFDIAADSVTVGAGAAYVPDYEGSNDYRIVPAPLVVGSVKGFAFTVIGNRATLDLFPNRSGQSVDLQAGPIASLNFNRATPKSIDDVRIRALGKRGTAFEVGGYIGIGKSGVLTSPYDKLSLSVSYRKGVSGGHRSEILEPLVSYVAPLSTKMAVGVFGSAQYVGAGYARAYFSIDPAQSSASGLPTFTARKGWKSYSTGGFVTYALTGNLLHGLKVIGGGGYTRALGDFSYSPVTRIAGSPNQWIGAAGLAYTF